ncbi:MAG: cytochrome c [Cyanobacteria bacterium TGS_CYA1]|nr:cytochrome c [Cyanobacteria bacterium TGS_CYA1]
MFNWKNSPRQHFHRYFPAILVTAICCFATSANAQNTNQLFTEKCAGCHTVGGGALVGPDLASVSSWNVSDLRSAVKRMEQSAGPLKDEEVDALVDFLKQQNNLPSPATKNKETSKTTQEQPETSQILELASSENGKKLFTGQTALQNGGLSCIACHQSNGRGGNMGPDLTLITKKFPGNALVSGIEKTPYKVMKSAYKAHPVTHQEALDIAAYLNETAKIETKHERTSPLTVGAGIALAVLGLIAFGYRNRKGSARANLKRRK